MRRARGVDHKRLHVSDIREERENREVVDELLCRLRVALYLEREDRTASVREIFLARTLQGTTGCYTKTESLFSH